MFYLILAIFSSAMVSVTMRLSEGKIKNNFGMLVMNYLMCSLLAALSAGVMDMPRSGFAVTAALGGINGVFYLVSFALLQVNIRRNGVVLSSTFMKLGLLVTIAISVCVYREIPTVFQTAGFVLAVGAIVLINYRKEKNEADFKTGLLWLMLCGGMADAMSKVFEESGVPGLGNLFLFFTFSTALVCCVLCMLLNRQRIGKAEAGFGLLIGIPNYYSSKFLLWALGDIPAVIAYPVYSVAGILVVTLAGVLLFRERLEKRRWIALGIILAALVLLNM